MGGEERRDRIRHDVSLAFAAEKLGVGRQTFVQPKRREP
jgi:hypothetical protein